MNKSVKLKNQFIKNDTDKLTLISGPCLLESEDPLPRFWIGGSRLTATNCHADCHLTIIPIF